MPEDLSERVRDRSPPRIEFLFVVKESLERAGARHHRWTTVPSIDRHGNIPGRSLSPAAVALIVKRRALAAGLDPRLFTGHSLRGGYVTQAKRNDATDLGVISQTHHRSADSPGYLLASESGATRVLIRVGLAGVHVLVAAHDAAAISPSV